MKYSLHVPITILVFMFLSMSAPPSKGDENVTLGEGWVFMSPEWFLGNTSIEQTYYVNGVLDTLNHIRVHGAPSTHAIECIFADTDDGTVRAMTGSFTYNITSDRVESGDTDFSVASELFRQLEHECKLDRFRD